MKKVDFWMFANIVPRTRLKIRDDRSLAADETIAWAAIRLDRLKTGYRLIHLVDPQGLPTDGVLLANISKTVS